MRDLFRKPLRHTLTSVSHTCGKKREKISVCLELSATAHKVSATTKINYKILTVLTKARMGNLSSWRAFGKVEGTEGNEPKSQHTRQVKC